jgi:hypothetical protein
MILILFKNYFFSCLDQLNTSEMHKIIAGEQILNYRILTANAYALLSVATKAICFNYINN